MPDCAAPKIPTMTQLLSFYHSFLLSHAVLLNHSSALSKADTVFSGVLPDMQKDI